MLKKGMTVKEAAMEYVKEMNQFPTDMIEALMRDNPADWSEVTLPTVYDRVYIYNANELGEVAKIDSEYGKIKKVNYNEETDETTYTIETDCSEMVELNTDDFEVQHDGILPMWGTMWNFKDSLDDDWLESHDGIRIMSDCGFQIYHHDEWGYFFGIDGAGYDFYEHHWIPLYKARGLQWHDENTETEESEDDE